MKRFIVMTILLFALAGVFAACGGAGESAPRAGSNWDEMHWDEGNWA